MRRCVLRIQLLAWFLSEFLELGRFDANVKVQRHITKAASLLLKTASRMT